MPNVFRWNVARREQLGRLVSGEPAPNFPHLVEAVRSCCARVIAMAGDSRFVFIGRSPESLYDYLTGAFAETSWADRLALVNVSLKTYGDWVEPTGTARASIRELFAAGGLDPATIATNAHPVALIDLIYQGETFGKLLDMIFSFASEGGIDHRAVRRRLRIVGITERSADGPKTARWQRLDWARAFPPRACKGVAIDYWLWNYLGDCQKKVSRPNPPTRWTDPEMRSPPREPEYVEALGFAVAIHDTARTRVERNALAAAIAEQPAMRQPWCRTLVTELRTGNRPRRSDRAMSSKRRVRSWKSGRICYR